ncbi:hypothetical protein [Solirubrobacter soli]|uniref:hypothetical protein n=1 Tax=Solirubrobacter soli TaxID=363832 RepID=UPI0012F885D2|nr:hypothetical protein [Solirubrobacter soli]
MPVAVAHAGTYDVRSCGANSPQAFTVANESPQTIASGTVCPQSGSRLLSGMYAGVMSSGFTLARAGASWTIAAPAGLTLQRLDLKRSLGRVSSSWYVTASTPAKVLEACDQGDPATCRLGNAGGEITAYTDLNAPSVTFRLECHPPEEDLACVGRNSTQAWVAIYNATARVNDPAPPVFEPLGLAPGWHSGIEPLTVAAADPSGIKSLSVSAGTTSLVERKQTCDYTRMQPCPASARESLSIDTTKLADGTYPVKAVATDAADQAAAATTELRIDRRAPAAPQALAVQSEADGTTAFVWTNPDQGTAAPIAAAHYEVCGTACVEGVATGPAIARLDSVVLPAGSNLVRVWLEDQAGNADRANAATLTVDPSIVSAPRPIDLNPPVFAAGAAPAFRVTSARRSGSTLTLSGTIAKAATARITAKVTHGRASVTAQAKPKNGRWTVKLKLSSALRRSSALSATLTFAGQTAFRGSTIRRQLTKRPRTDEFRIKA